MADKFKSMPYDKPADNCVAFIQIFVRDLARAQAFYEAVFGWTFQSEAYAPTITVFKTGGQVLGALHVRDTEPVADKQPSILTFVKVADVAATLEIAREAGGKVVKEKWTEENHTDMGELEDTEGNRLGLLHWLM